MDRCPNCRARREDGETCRRCGMDLTPLLDLERAAAALIARAVRELAAGEVDNAAQTLAQAEGLRADPLVSHLRRWASGESRQSVTATGSPTRIRS